MLIAHADPHQHYNTDPCKKAFEYRPNFSKILFIPQLSLSGRYNDEQNKYRPRLQEASGFIGKKSRVALLRFTKPSNASWQARRARANVCEHLPGTEEEKLSMVTWLSLYFHFNLLCRGRFTSWQTKKICIFKKKYLMNKISEFEQKAHKSVTAWMK